MGRKGVRQGSEKVSASMQEAGADSILQAEVKKQRELLAVQQKSLDVLVEALSKKTRPGGP